MRKGSENQVIQFLLDDGKIRGAILDSSLIVGDCAKFHGYGPVETLIIGQALSAAALLCITVKGRDRLRLSIECGGPIGGLVVDTNADGDVRGYLQNNPIKLETSKEVTMDNLYGPGFLHIMRQSEGAKTPFTGSVDLLYPDLASNLAYYYTTSEQTPSAFGFSVDIDKAGHFNGAAAIFIQALPGADEEVLKEVQEKLQEVSSLYNSILKVGDPAEWVNSYFSKYNPALINLKNSRFLCPCNRAQIESFVKGLGRDKSDELIDEENGGFMVKCHSCSQEYHFNKEELNKLFK